MSQPIALFATWSRSSNAMLVDHHKSLRTQTVVRIFSKSLLQ